jgi:hypothetical protein
VTEVEAEHVVLAAGLFCGKPRVLGLEPAFVDFGPMCLPHRDVAIGTGERAAGAIAGQAGPYQRLQYWRREAGALVQGEAA